MPLALDLPAVEAALAVALSPPPRLISAEQFDSGQSNPTYLLTSLDASRIVLRRKPEGSLLPSAHDVLREHRVLCALQHTRVPVPRPLHLCTDRDVLGVEWYVMEYVQGRIFDGGDNAERLEDSSEGERREMWRHAAEVLAELHQVDYAAVGLQRHGKPGGGYASESLEALAESRGADRRDRFEGKRSPIKSERGVLSRPGGRGYLE